MPTLHLTGLDADLVLRVRAYARERGLRTPAGAAELLASGLTLTHARRAGAHATNAGMTADERSERARTAAAARWAR